MSSQLSADLASLKISRGEKPPSSKGRWLLYGAILILISFGLVLGGKLVYPLLLAKVFKTEVSLTEVTLLSPVQSSVELTGTGYIAAQTLSKVGSKVQGRVQKVFVKQGDVVKAGDVLFQLEDEEARSALFAAKARLASAQARTKTARARFQETDVQLLRATKLAAQGAEPPSRVEDLKVHADALHAEIKASTAEAQATMADIETQKINVHLLRIVAPISGTVVTKPPEVGEILSPANPIIELVDFSNLVVEVDVPESRIQKLTIGMPCEVVLDAFPGKRLMARMVEMVPRINRAKASALVKVRIEETFASMLPDMAARVNFLQSEPDQKALLEKPKLFLPNEAVVKKNGDSVVFVVREGVAKQVPVTLGPALLNGYEILQGPSAGTKVVKNPPATLSDGQQVKEKTEER